MCSTAPSSQIDFLVITQDGVYIYDKVADFTFGPCKGPLQFTTVFGGYSDLTSVDQVTGMLVYQNYVELFSTDEIYVTLLQGLVGILNYNMIVTGYAEKVTG